MDTRSSLDLIRSRFKGLPLVRKMEDQIEDVTFKVGTTVVQDDDDLQRKIREFTQNGDGGEHVLRAQVAYKEGSAMNELDKDLAAMVLESGTPAAADDLIKDGVVSSSQLPFIRDFSNDQMPNAGKHSNLRTKLSEAKDLKAKEAEEDEAKREAPKHEQLKAKIDVIEEMREALEAYDSINKEVEEGLEGDAKTNREAIEAKVKNVLDDALSKVGHLQFLGLPDNVINDEVVSNFMAKRRSEFDANVHFFTGGEHLTAVQLINIHEVLNGVLIKHGSGDKFSKKEALVRYMPGRGATIQQIGQDILSNPPEKSVTVYEQFDSQTVAQMAGDSVHRLGSATSGNTKASGVMAGEGGIGAVSVAAAVASGLESFKNTKEQESISEQESALLYYTVMPQKTLHIPRGDLRLHPRAYKELERISEMKDQKQDVRRFLETYGSHVCPKLLLGGTWTRIASARASTKTTQQQLVTGVAAALKGQGSLAVSGFTTSGFGKGGGAVDHSKDNVNVSAMDEKTQEVYHNTRFIKKTDVGPSDLSLEEFYQRLEHNSNWAVISIHMESCASVWSFARSIYHQKFTPEFLGTIFDVWARELSGYDDICRKAKAVGSSVANMALCKEDDNGQPTWASGGDEESKFQKAMKEANIASDLDNRRWAKCKQKHHCKGNGFDLKLVEKRELEEKWVNVPKVLAAIRSQEPRGKCVPVNDATDEVKCECNDFWEGAVCDQPVNLTWNCFGRRFWLPCTAHPLSNYYNCSDRGYVDLEGDDGWRYCPGAARVLTGQKLCEKQWKCYPVKTNENSKACCSRDQRAVKGDTEKYYGRQGVDGDDDDDDDVKQ
eukprot:TRINITY_DN91937_c0_g1_i1.p1 TRINITY_DN91937_c0_g1~~TRINITY_DN91937_c0_g1_i1.p1  ORF type:complete len:958 (+),score=201.21 TRINITY_DN91937_c0_g1_i1:381-2876(+)